MKKYSTLRANTEGYGVNGKWAGKDLEVKASK